MKVKEPVVLDPNAPAPKLSPEDQQLADMDKYYTNFNWELPNQKLMVMPLRPKKEKKKKDDSTASSYDAINVKEINYYPSENDLLNLNRVHDQDDQQEANSIEKAMNGENLVLDVSIPEARFSFLMNPNGANEIDIKQKTDSK